MIFYAGTKNNNINYYWLLLRISEICNTVADTAGGGSFFCVQRDCALGSTLNIITSEYQIFEK